MALNEGRRKQLDSIVVQMTKNKEPEANIRAVVNDFKSKYESEGMVGQQTTTQKPLLQQKQGGVFSALHSGIGRLLTGGTQKFAETLGTAAAVVTGEAGKIDEAAVKESESRRQLSELLTRPDITETQKARIRKQIGMGQQVGVAQEQLPAIQKSTTQVVGEGALTGLEALSGGALSAAKGAVVKPITTIGLKGAMATGAKIGATYGAIGSAASSASEGGDVIDIVSSGATGSLVGGALGAATVPIANLVARGVTRGAELANKGVTAIRQFKAPKLAESLSQIDTYTLNTLDPLRQVEKSFADDAARAGAKEMAEDGVGMADDAARLIPEGAKRQSAERLATVETRLNYYVDKAKRAVQDASQDTPLELAGKEAEGALSIIQDKMHRAGALKQQMLGETGNKLVPGIDQTKALFNKKLGERIGAVLQDGEIVNAPGRVSKIALDRADQKLVSDVYALLDNLDDADTVFRADGTVDAIQDLLYKRKQNVAQPVSSAVEGLLKEVTGELNAKTTRTAGATYAKANRRYAALADVRDALNKALGAEGSKGGSLMKRVFSPTDGGTKRLFATIEKITGIDLVDEATLAKFAMEAVGDARQKSILEELQIIGSKGVKGAVIDKMIEGLLSKFTNKEEAARKILQAAKVKANTPNILPLRLPK